MKIYTIGFTQKSAQLFFDLLLQHRIRLLVDIRLKPTGQLSGFAKKDDLPFFLDRLVDHCTYLHLPELAPSEEILQEYRNGKNWFKYEEQFKHLMLERNIPHTLNRKIFEESVSCLLCSEASPEHCHRRLVAERIAEYWSGFEIVHL